MGVGISQLVTADEGIMDFAYMHSNSGGSASGECVGGLWTIHEAGALSAKKQPSIREILFLFLATWI